MPDTAYKLLTPEQTSYRGCLWTVGEWKETDGSGELCGPGWLHFYSSPELAVMLNPIHAKIPDPVGWRVETDGARLDDRGLKHGRTRARIIERVELPVVTMAMRVRFAILCAMALPGQPAEWTRWAKRWLSGKDRTAAEAALAARAARAAAWAAEEAAMAARVAEEAAGAAEAAWAAEAAAVAARAARAARAAGQAALDLDALAMRAIREEAERE